MGLKYTHLTHYLSRPLPHTLNKVFGLRRPLNRALWVCLAPPPPSPHLHASHLCVIDSSPVRVCSPSLGQHFSGNLSCFDAAVSVPNLRESRRVHTRLKRRELNAQAPPTCQLCRALPSSTGLITHICTVKPFLSFTPISTVCPESSNLRTQDYPSLLPESVPMGMLRRGKSFRLGAVFVVGIFYFFWKLQE